MLKKSMNLLLGASFALSLMAGTSLAETLKFGHYANTGDTAHLAAEKFKSEVETNSNGELTVELYPSGELGNSPTMLEGVRLGTIDLVLVGSPYFSSFAPQLNLLDLPFLFTSAEHAYSVMDGEVGQALMDSLNSAGLQGLAFWEIGFRNLSNNKRPVKEPADMAGLKIRTTPNPAHIEAFTILGANPTPMPFSEVYSALQTGTIDGQENPTHHIYASKLHEVQKYLSLTAHAYTAAPLVMNMAKFNHLSDAQKTIVKEAALSAAGYERELNAAKEVESLQAMKDAGVEVEEHPDVAAFRDAVAEKTRASYVDKFGDELLKEVDALAR